MSEEFKIEIVNPEKSLSFKRRCNRSCHSCLWGRNRYIERSHFNYFFFETRYNKNYFLRSEEKKYYVEDGIVEFKNNNLSILTSSIFNIKNMEKSKIEEILKTSRKWFK